MNYNQNSEIIKPPIYDGKEEYYIFKRRWDEYISITSYKKLYEQILQFFNELFNLDHKNLLSIKNIKKEDISSEKIIKLIESKQLKDVFKVRYKNDPCKVLNNILNKINFSFVETKKDGESFYSIKQYKQIQSS